VADPWSGWRSCAGPASDRREASPPDADGPGFSSVVLHPGQRKLSRQTSARAVIPWKSAPLIWDRNRQCASASSPCRRNAASSRPQKTASALLPGR
jgi:hypothetical protein